MVFDWPWITISAGASAMSVIGTLGYGAFWPRSRFFGPVVFRGEASDPPCVAITFDDGPCAKATPAILDILAKHDVQATFFVIGCYAKRYPEILQRMDAEDHLVANHSYDHSHYGMFRKREYWMKQLKNTDQAIESAIHRKPVFFRPPMGFKQHHITGAVKHSGHTMVTWTQRALDGRFTTPKRIVSRLTTNVIPGAIFAMHDGIDPNVTHRGVPAVEAIGPLIYRLRDLGVSIIRLDKLLHLAAYR